MIPLQGPAFTLPSFPTGKVTISPLGLEIAEDLDFDEWSGLASMIGNAARSVSFLIGDWLVYGQSTFQADGDNRPAAAVSSDRYRAALAATGFDLSTLHNYAYVSRNVPISRRSEQLSWEHHRQIAKLPAPDQERWIATCHAEQKAGRPISTRRLHKSIHLGRIATPEDMEPDLADKGIVNHIPFVNRLVSWWRRMQDEKFLQTATRAQRDALKRDLKPIVAIYEML